ncbi:MAG TPA: 50S ribosomal protein L11 methyltransferase, partial [Clostridiales bacterium]|nr:50S ribosomal protein L11 methyltransferase [Clostridiales bacterium]
KAEGIWHEISSAARRNEDWENNWKEFFKPFPVGEKLYIRPVWEELDSDEAGGRKVLSIEPGLAFGNGSHETTKLCLEALEDHVKPESEILDIGCGSGILSLASLLLGAKSALGVDIDELAVKTALENGRLNGLAPPAYEILHGNLLNKVSGIFDIVVANIVADAVIEISKDAAKFLKLGGVFIVSGIIDLRADEVKAALVSNGFKLLKSRQEGDWFCFEATL